MRKPFLIKVEDGSEEKLGNSIMPGNEHHPAELMNDIGKPRPLRAGGPDLRKIFDKSYPAVAHMVMNEILDERDDVGSLCDFVEEDE